jgi:hypothetical protein
MQAAGRAWLRAIGSMGKAGELAARGLGILRRATRGGVMREA